MGKAGTAPLSELVSGRGFERYQPGLRSRFGANRFRYEVTYREPTVNPAIRIDLESAQQIGRIAAWESGACDLEVIDVSTGETALFEHRELRNEDEFHQALARLFLFLRV